MENVRKLIGGFIAAGVLAVAGVGLAQDDSATGTVEIINQMASTIEMLDSEPVTITILELGDTATGVGHHSFSYKNHTFDEAQITAKLEDTIDGLTLTALVSVQGGNGTPVASVQLDTTAQPIISGVQPAAAKTKAEVAFEAVANQPITAGSLAVTYTISSANN